MTAPVAAPRPAGKPKIRNLRWVVGALLFFSTVINYVDRQNLSVLARTIQNDLHFSDMQYAWVVQAFLFAYTIMYVVAGRLTDRLGARISMLVFVVWWSLADMLTSLSRSVWSLGFFRFLLGMGEPGNYTAAPKAVSEWFPPKERGLVIGLYTAGATLGAALAPPLIALLASRLGWRGAFLCTGGMGLVWAVVWWQFYQRPERHPRITAEELALVTAKEQPEETDAGGSGPSPWREALRSRETWFLLAGRLLTDPVWYFYLFWFPKYLTDARHLSLGQLGQIGWLVYLAADLGCLAGGVCSAWLVRRGATPIGSRWRVMVTTALIAPVGVLVLASPSPITAVLAVSVTAFAHLAWQVSLGAMILDLFPKRLVGTVFGLVAAGSGLGGMVATNLIGRTVSQGSYTPVFLILACMHPLALALLAVARIGSRKLPPLARAAVVEGQSH